MLKSCLTGGTLVFDMSDRVTSNDEAYAVTTRGGDVPACARSIVHLMNGRAHPVAGAPASDDLIRYGQEIRVQSNDFICNKSLYLSSQPISPLAFARFSRNQEVSLLNKSTYNTVWKIWPVGVGRGAKLGQPVLATDKVSFEHCATI